MTDDRAYAAESMPAHARADAQRHAGRMRPRLACALVALIVASCASAGPPRVAGADPSGQTSNGTAGAAGGAIEPRADRDHDGVRDEDDRCPDAPEDCDGFEDLDGCPDDDNDKDGIPDRCDRCPDRPSMRRDGCPLIRLLVQDIVVPMVATFERNQSKPTFGPELEAMLAAMNNADTRRIGIVGHALASEKNGARLAARRAEAVRDALVAKGVPVDKFELRSAPAGVVDACPADPSGQPSPLPCVSFSPVDVGRMKMTWDGKRYVAPPEPPIPDLPGECAPPQTEGSDCSKG